MAERRLAAIMFSDIVGYTALMGESEQRGRRVRERHRAVLGPLADRHHRQIVDENGDELVPSFPSALDAVNCATTRSCDCGSGSTWATWSSRTAAPTGTG